MSSGSPKFWRAMVRTIAPARLNSTTCCGELFRIRKELRLGQYVIPEPTEVASAYAPRLEFSTSTVYFQKDAIDGSFWAAAPIVRRAAAASALLSRLRPTVVLGAVPNVPTAVVKRNWLAGMLAAFMPRPPLAVPRGVVRLRGPARF